MTTGFEHTDGNGRDWEAVGLQYKSSDGMCNQLSLIYRNPIQTWSDLIRNNWIIQYQLVYMHMPLFECATHAGTHRNSTNLKTLKWVRRRELLSLFTQAIKRSLTGWCFQLVFSVIKGYQGLIDAQVLAKENLLRKENANSHFYSSRVKYILECALMYNKEALIYSADNKNKNKVGDETLTRESK